MHRLLLVLALGIVPLVGQAGPPPEKRARPAAANKKKARPSKRCKDIFCTSQVLRLDGSTAEVKGLTEEQVEDVMQTHHSRLEPCLIEARRRDPNKNQARVEFVVTGGGKVLAVRVDGKRATTLARCIGKQMTGIHFPTFSRPRMVAAVTLAVPE